MVSGRTVNRIKLSQGHHHCHSLSPVVIFPSWDPSTGTPVPDWVPTKHVDASNTRITTRIPDIGIPTEHRVYTNHRFEVYFMLRDLMGEDPAQVEWVSENTLFSPSVY